MKSYSGTIQHVHSMIYTPIVFYYLDVGLIFMNFPMSEQLHYRRCLYTACLKTKQNPTKPHLTPNIPVQLLLAPHILRSHGQVHSIVISWITQNNLLLISSLDHDDNNRIHLDFHIEIQGISSQLEHQYFVIVF